VVVIVGGAVNGMDVSAARTISGVEPTWCCVIATWATADRDDDEIIGGQDNGRRGK